MKKRKYTSANDDQQPGPSNAKRAMLAEPGTFFTVNYFVNCNLACLFFVRTVWAPCIISIEVTMAHYLYSLADEIDDQQVEAKQVIQVQDSSDDEELGDQLSGNVHLGNCLYC